MHGDLCQSWGTMTGITFLVVPHGVVVLLKDKYLIALKMVRLDFVFMSEYLGVTDTQTIAASVRLTTGLRTLTTYRHVANLAYHNYVLN